ncbi:MAG: M81 family metallopeptidase [Pseudomonadota bacterium]
MRIAIAGFQHETNTFVASRTRLDDFEQADSWPALLCGSEVVKATRGMNLPIAGFAKAAAGQDLQPVLWCAAEPGGKVTTHAFETITAQILAGITDAGPLDAVYLDLHGAMVTDTCEDGEGELLSRIRAVIGPDVWMVASLDMHANVSRKMVTQTDAMTIFRTYPHLDMAETGARAFRMLSAMQDHGRPAKIWRQGDYLIPVPAQHTNADPARSLYAALRDLDGSGMRLAEIALGFTAADITDTGPSILAYSTHPQDATAIAQTLYDRLSEAEQAFRCPLLSPAQAVLQARQAPRGRPVVIADVQDNPGAGASSDTTGLLRELIVQNAPPTLFGLFHDPALASAACRAGPGAQLDAAIGGRGPGDQPLHAQVRVCATSDGQCVYTGEMYGGGTATLGPSAALELVGTRIRIVVTSIRNQCLDLAQFRHFDLEPEDARILCVKSTAHFRADFEPIAQQVLLCAAPGQFPCLLRDVPYANLRPGVRLTG